MHRFIGQHDIRRDQMRNSVALAARHAPFDVRTNGAYTWIHVRSLRKDQQEKMKKVIIMRGCPGAGKSYRATQHVKNAEAVGSSSKTVSADDYFMIGGRYVWDPKKLGAAHAACFSAFIDALLSHVELVIVDNTNITINEFETYVRVALLADYDVVIDEIKPDADSIAMWHARCVHAVPLASILKRSKQWENFNVHDMIERYAQRTPVADV